MNRREFVAGSLAAAALLRAREAPAQTPAQANGVRILVFDTFGTVVDWRGSLIAEGERLGKAKGLNVDWAAFADAWRGGYGPSMNRVRKGDLPWTKLDALHRMILDELLVKYKIENLSEEEKRHLNYVWHRLKPWPDSVQGLTRLKKKFVIAPLSNGNVSLLTNMAKQAGLPWDAILSTEIVKRYKPDRETYLMAAEFWDVEPARRHDGGRARRRSRRGEETRAEDGLRPPAARIRSGPHTQPARRRQLRLHGPRFQRAGDAARGLGGRAGGQEEQRAGRQRAGRAEGRKD